MIDATLVNLLVQGGFAAMFVWLLLDTRAESRKREERLTTLLDKYADGYQKIAETLEHIERQMAKDRG